MLGPSRPATRFGLLLIALAATAWGTTGAATVALVEGAGAEPLIIALVRLWTAALLLGAAALSAGRLSIARADRWRCVGMGACMAVFQVAYFTAVTLSGVAVAALVAICSAPILIAVLAVTCLGERMGSRVGAALAAGVGGAALLVVAPWSGAARPRDAVGVLLALAAGLSYAVYAVLAKASLDRSPPLPLAAATFGIGAVLLSPAAAWVDGVARQIGLGWPWLLYLGGIATAAAYALYMIGLRSVTTSRAGIVTLLEPLIATVLGVLVFGERLEAAQLVGGVLLLGGVVLLFSGAERGTEPRRT